LPIRCNTTPMISDGFLNRLKYLKKCYSRFTRKKIRKYFVINHIVTDLCLATVSTYHLTGFMVIKKDKMNVNWTDLPAFILLSFSFFLKNFSLPLLFSFRSTTCKQRQKVYLVLSPSYQDNDIPYKNSFPIDSDLCERKYCFLRLFFPKHTQFVFE
jgi:hypothetical protein